MKSNKKIHPLFIISFLCSLLVIPFLKNTSLKSADAEAEYHYVIMDSGSFSQNVTYKDKTYKYTFYRIEDHDLSLAISWAESTDLNISHLDIPSTITSTIPTGVSKSYTVVAIARGGFSRCRFQTVDIPQTVEDIMEDAFAYCVNLKRVQIPREVSVISNSAFLDCRSLTSVQYSTDEGKRTSANNIITYFGEHCFDSCISLASFKCPSSAVYFGKSCFQKCTSLSSFSFPIDKTVKTPSADQNVITVKDYAFADCSSLLRVYFDRNLKFINNYAFADCNEALEFYFYGEELELPDFSSTPFWRHKKITNATDSSDPENIKDFSTIQYDLHCQTTRPEGCNLTGLTCSYVNSAQLLDNARTELEGRSEATSVTIIPAHAANDKYAIITGFDVPGSDDWDKDYYYDGELTIPESVMDEDGTEYDVLAIGPMAFAEKSEITKVHFSENLMQIQNKAFYHSNNIEELDFSACTNLKEISYSIFNEIIVKDGRDKNNAVADGNSDVKWGNNTETEAGSTIHPSNINSKVTSINLPSCLQYLGNFAFYNFTNLTDEDAITFKDSSGPSQLKIIGDYAFSICTGASTNKPYIPGTFSTTGLPNDNANNLDTSKAKTNLVLPKSLTDSEAPVANIFHSFSWDRGKDDAKAATVNASIFNRVAVNKNAFENQLCLATVTMEADGADGTHDISFGSNAFVRCRCLQRFESSANLCLIGMESFKQCPSLREVFLHTKRAFNNKSACYMEGEHRGELKDPGEKINNPWGVRDGSNSWEERVFNNKNGNTVYSEIVIYVDPNGTTNQPKYPNSGSEWYGANFTDYSNGLTGNNRLKLPVYFVDWKTSTNVKYWHLNNTTNSVGNYDSGPKTVDDYKDGYISFVKQGTNYTVARYFTDGVTGNYSKKVDLTTTGLTIDTIGEEAFGGSKAMGFYFILPHTVTNIGQRAFYRNSVNNAVRIVTFKTSGGTVMTPSDDIDDEIATIEAVANDKYKIGFCYLSNDITNIYNQTFYNNIFGSVNIGKNVAFIGDGAFYNHVKEGKITSFTFTDYNAGTSPDTNTYFTAEGNGSGDGLYYTYGGACTLFQANTGDTGDLTIKSGTNMIYYQAAASTKFSSVTFNTDVDSIAIGGRSFAYCTSLTTLNSVSKIQYIGVSEGMSKINPNQTSVVNSTDGNSFEGCTNLKIEFSQMKFLQKIGASAFYDCKNIVNFTPATKTYQFYTSTAGGNPDNWSGVSNATKVLDLSTLSNLDYIGSNAFNGKNNACDINYAILPNPTASSAPNYSSTAPGLKCRATIFKTNTIKLCGETAQQADQSSSNFNYNNVIADKYPTNALCADYSKLYYRVHSTNDLLDPELTTITRQYWTAIKTGNADVIRIILFPNRSAAETWLGNPTNLANQCHAFPEA